jgi:uncharacterized glyoxalase superfamily protein PhnB
MPQQESQHPQGAREGTDAYQAPDVIPFMRYEDAPAAIDWLERAFGFERHMVVEGNDNRIDHAELRFGSGMVMLGSTREGAQWEGDVIQKIPRQLGGAVTSGVYLIVDDPDAHHDHAKAAGAEIVTELSDQEYGSRDYSARDPEGYLWHFGTYRPAGG